MIHDESVEYVVLNERYAPMIKLLKRLTAPSIDLLFLQFTEFNGPLKKKEKEHPPPP